MKEGYIKKPDAIELYLRALVKVEAEAHAGGFNAYAVTLTCGHVTMFMTFPTRERFYCPQCLHEHLDTWKQQKKVGT